MRKTVIATAALAVIGTTLGQTLATADNDAQGPATGTSTVAGQTAIVDSGTAVPGGSGIQIGKATWTASGISAQFGGAARPANSASMQPALGRGLALGDKYGGGISDPP